MSDIPDTVPPRNQERKDKYTTHKVVGYGGGLIGALALLNGLRNEFAPKEKVDNLAAVTSKLEQKFDTLDSNLTDKINLAVAQMNASNQRNTDEIIHRMERGWDKTSDRIKDSEARGTKTTDHLQKQIDEIIAFRLKSKNTY